MDCIVSFILSLSSLVLALADVEHTQHGSQHLPNQRHMGRSAKDLQQDHFGSAGENHNVEFDHEAILGSHEANEEFAALPPHEAKKHLARLLVKMDHNQDRLINIEELTSWISKSLRKQEESYALTKLQEVDANKDERVSWGEYLQRIYGYTEEDMKLFENDTRPEMKTFLVMVNDDKEKFRLADRDGSGDLVVLEYVAFLYPHSYGYMHDHEIQRTLDDLDKNNDAMISFDEYVGPSKPGAEQMEVDRENFESYDLNKDGRLDHREIREWILPDQRSIAEDEAAHLIAETDSDNNGILTTQEILDRHDLWVGSSATDYGDGLMYHEEL